MAFSPMLKRVLGAALVAVFLVLLFAWFSVQSASNDDLVLNEQELVDEFELTTPPDSSPDTAPASDADEVWELLPSPPPPPPESLRAARVERLADGDSFDIEWVDSGERDEVRLQGLNAPEKDTCFSEGSKETLSALLGGQVDIEMIERDEFGRVLANAWNSGDLVNLRVVELGAAVALSGVGEHADLLAQAQEEAQATGSGLWNLDACGPGDASMVRIVWIEADAPGRDDQNKNGEWIEIENQGSTPADLTDWSVRDESTRHRYTFPDGFVLEPSATVRVYSGCGDDNTTELYWCDDDPVWNNRGDTGFLVTPEGGFADSRSYGEG